jgi:hypothetical protein
MGAEQAAGAADFRVRKIRSDAGQYHWKLRNSPPVTSATNIPASGDEIVVHTFAMPVDPNLVQGWLSGQTTHEGVLLSSGASEPTEFYLLAQGSESPPELQARLCLP